jgi:cytochrome P450
MAALSGRGMPGGQAGVYGDRDCEESAMTAGQDHEELVRLVLAPGTSGDPFGNYLRLREVAGVYRSERTGMTLLSRQADCLAVLNDKETFRVVDTAWMTANIPGWKPSPGQEQFLSSLFFRNPPEHTRLRRQIAKGFTTRRLQLIRPMVEQEVRRALDRLATSTPGKAVDLQELVSVPLSLAVLGGLLGVPEQDQPRCWTLLHQAIPAPDPDADQAAREAVQRQADAASAEMADFFLRLVRAKRAAPGDDLISAYLTEQAGAPECLTDHELALAMLPIFGAGAATLSNTVGNMFHALLGNPEALDRLAAGAFAPERAAAEVLRYCGGYHITRRYAVHDTEVGAVKVPAGSVLVLLLASANRDPRCFDEPEVFGIERAENPSLVFGAGIHYCLGAALARLLIETLCAELHRVPGLRSAGRAQWRPDLLFFGPAKLPVTVGYTAGTTGTLAGTG